MKYISKYPFQALTFFVLVYFVGIVFLFEPTSAWNKLVFFLISVFIFLFLSVFAFTFRYEIKIFRDKFFNNFLTGRFQKLPLFLKTFQLLEMSIVPLILASLMEFILTLLFTNAGAITVGFPLPFYSFTSNIFLGFNFFIDIILYTLTTYFLGYAVSRYPDIQDF